MNAMNEAREIYDRARKRAQKQQALSRQAGESGFLPMLDAKREECGVLAYMAQPQRTISLERVVGTYQSSRSNAFAANFMPLLSDSSEFGGKWIALCASHLESGIRDPIRVYEYLWRYYVAEGNKRVSVLKYFGAQSYEAEITRLIPQYDENDADICRYYTFLAYAKKGAFPDIELSQSKKYERLYRIEQKLLSACGEDEKPDCNAMYLLFESAYLQTDRTLSLGDAFLEYLHIYGFPTGSLPEEIAARIRTLQPQLEILEHPASPRLVLEDDAATPPLFSRLFGHKNPKIVFAYAKGRTQYNWLGAHEIGRVGMQKELGERVSSVCLDDMDRDNAYALLSEQAGNAGLVFVTSPSFMNPVLRFALENPNVMTLVYSRMQHHYRLHTYFGRYYEAVFICGAAAGLMTKTGVIAYVTPALQGVRYTSDVNAFAIGARSVRPDARVLFVTKAVSPADLSTCAQGVHLAHELGADVVLTPRYEAIPATDLPNGVFSVLMGLDETGTPNRYIAAPDWNWDRFYTAIVRSYLNGSLTDLLSDDADSPLTSFWWGIGAGVIDVRLSAAITGPANNLLRYLKSSIAQNQFNPFHGPVLARDQTVLVPPHSDARPAEIMNMRGFVSAIEPIEAEEPNP